MCTRALILKVARGIYVGSLVLALFVLPSEPELADLVNANPLPALLFFVLVVVPAPLLFKGIEDVDPHFTLDDMMGD
ncbi:MAG: hypothetical protein R3349_10205 [Geminicoccaceae bacterium]|nr:hypothetical protein [Geminicoccaceae bacterium]